MTPGPQADRGQASLRVLVVDDYEDDAESCAALLRMVGYDVTIALDGEQALAAARQRMPDAVLLDLWMPAMDGFTVAERILAMASKKPLIIVISGSDRPENAQRCEALGIEHHFVKPTDSWAILRLLKEFAASRPAS